MRRMVFLCLAAALAAGCSDDDPSEAFLNECIRYNSTLTEATPVECSEAHIGKVVAVVDESEDCPDTTTSTFGVESKLLCIDNLQ